VCCPMGFYGEANTGNGRTRAASVTDAVASKSC